MNISTLTISGPEAQQKLDQYRSILGKRRVKEDDKLEALYASITKGARVLNLAEAFKQTGLNDQQQPKLAIARADWKTVYCVRNPSVKASEGWSNSVSNTVGFTSSPRWNYLAMATNIVLPANTFAWKNSWNEKYKYHQLNVSWSVLTSPVPHIPPSCRPKFGLHNYHILFEVEKWQTYPVDPFLLRRISGMLFIVEAEWDLTPLEAELLASMRGGN